MPKDLRVINWEEALNQVGGDREFLLEVLQDLFNESATAEEEIQSGVDNKDFDIIEKAAHRIKGSASYLYCEALKEVSFQLQTAGHTGLKGAPNEAKLWDQIKEMFTDFKASLVELKNEINNAPK
jgi:HPt (histidine-containing phosphotransfer) domain-containing protein